MSTESAPYKVIVVVNREFGERLTNLDPPVWIVNTATNGPVVHRLWKNRPKPSHLHGITIFDDSGSASPEKLAIAILSMVDLHHGPYSADPPYTILEILGAPLTESLQSELRNYGFDKFEATPDGFQATRPKPLAAA